MHSLHPAAFSSRRHIVNSVDALYSSVRGGFKVEALGISVGILLPGAGEGPIRFQNQGGRAMKKPDKFKRFKMHKLSHRNHLRSVRFKRPAWWLTSISSVWVITTAGAESQARDVDSKRNIEEVIVTAQKRAERIQDVPLAVSSVDSERLISTGQSRIEDYYQRLPGVSFTQTDNGSTPTIIIRGLVTSPGGNPTTGVVIDEISYGGAVSLSFASVVPDVDPGDLARVEVLRGPQGTLYGASSMGGLLKYVTVDPSTEKLSGRLQVGSTSVRSGDDLGHSIRGAINVPLGDTLAVRLSGFTLSDPGYIDNPETGENDVNDWQSDGGRLSALWEPNDDLSLKFSALIQDGSRGGGADADLLLAPRLARNELRGIGGYDKKSEVYSSTITGSIGEIELVSATGYSIDEMTNSVEVGLGALAEGLFPGTGRSSIATWQESKRFTQEVRASIPVGERLTWLMGLYYTEEKDLYTVNVHANDSNGVPGGLILANLAIRPTSFEERAAFTNLTVDITDRFDIQFGGRFSENDQSFTRASVSFGANPLGAQPDFFQQSTATDHAFTYLVTPRLKISPDLMTYLRIASGYRPGGPNFNCGLLPADLCEFDADTSVNYEVGVKGVVLDQKLSFDTSVYYIDWKDLQVGPLIYDNPTRDQYFTNASGATSKGVELSVELKPLDGLRISLWGAYNEAELADGMAEPFSNGTALIPAGTRLPFSARLTGGASVEQAFPLTHWGDATATVGADASYVGERAGSLSRDNMDRAKPSYVQTNLRAGLAFDTWVVNAFVNNLTDKRGVLRGGDDALQGANHINYIRPRTLGLSLSKDF